MRQIDYPAFEILVVDSAPSRFQAGELAAQFGAGYLFEPSPGVSRARNRGARACSTDLVAMLDDDAIADPAWLLRLGAEFEDPAVAAVAGRIRTLQDDGACERALSGFHDADRGDCRQVIDRDVAHWFECTCFGGVGSGGNLAFRRSVFDVWTGFSETLGVGAAIPAAEEHHAFFSLVDLGFKVVYSPQAVVRHPYPRTVRGVKARHLRHLSASAAYVAFLFSEQPRFRPRILKYVFEAIRGKKRSWRAHPDVRGLRINPALTTLRALAAGAAKFAWLRAQRASEAGAPPSAVGRRRARILRPSGPY